MTVLKHFDDALIQSKIAECGQGTGRAGNAGTQFQRVLRPKQELLPRMDECGRAFRYPISAGTGQHTPGLYPSNHGIKSRILYYHPSEGQEGNGCVFLSLLY